MSDPEMPRVCDGMRRAALAVLLMLGATPGDAAPQVRQVLLLQSFDRGNLTLDQFTADFRVELDRRAGVPVNVVQVVVGPTGSVGAPEQATLDFIRSTFADHHKPDLIVTLAGPAAVFARKHRPQLFPDTPLLFAAVDQHFLRDAPLGVNEAAVTTSNDYPGLVGDIIHLLPNTREVVMVMGSGSLGQFWRQQLEGQFTQLYPELTFVWSDDLSLAELVQRCSSLPPDSAIFYIVFGTDAAGAAYADERVLSELHATAKAPVFGVQSVQLGYGIVGGRLMAIDELSRNTAAGAVRLLNGEPPSSVDWPPQKPGQPTYDWRELQMWGIPETRLPAGSVVRYRGPSLWREYRSTVLSAIVALVTQSILIAGLLYERRARQRAQNESRKNLALAADASRRLTMSALTSSITHELGQPLSSILYNAQALEMLASANRATPETIGEILSDIRTQGVRATQIAERHRTMLRSHQMDRKAIDLQAVVKESLALIAHDMEARDVDAVVTPSPTPCVIAGDQVLLQQVFVNLMMNAMDAMAETPPARRRITISTDVKTAGVEVSVRDTGSGLPTDIVGTVFTPFVTTKSQGLGIGLTISRTIVEAHGGTIDARNNSEGGATFTVTLPRSGAAELA